MTKKRKNVLFLVGAIIIGIAAIYFTTNKVTAPHTLSKSRENSAFDPKNSTFTLDKNPVTLVSGISSKEAAPLSSSKIITTYFGNEAYGDLNNDGKEDIAFLVTQSTGGSGTFYYVVVALKTDSGYTTTNAVFIGDRIAPQSTTIISSKEELLVNFAKRSDGEPMSTTPSIGSTLVLKVTQSGVLAGLMK